MSDEILKVGTKVVKHSGKPFKSALKINTVRGFDTNPYTGRICYTFEEDETMVECFRCKEYTE